MTTRFTLLPKALKVVVFTLLVAITAGCNVHEPWPGDADSNASSTPGKPYVPVTLKLNFDTELPLHKEVVYSRAAQDKRYMRYTVQVFAPSRAEGTEPHTTWTFRQPVEQTLDLTARVVLPDGNYELYVWADYVDAGSNADKYYDTTQWQSITVADIDNHQGSDERRDAFRGYVAKTVVNASEQTESNTIEIEMKRPLARFEFIATDFAQFAADERRARSQQEPMDTDADISPDDYQIVFYYREFTPTGYNVFTDKPNDAALGMQFASNITLTDRGASLGFDYVIVNGSETSVKLLLGIFDRKGNLISSTGEIEVPLVRGKNTLVTGEFLTAKTQGGVGVSPGFDGEYNIEI